MAISFSASVKAEISRSIPQKHCCALAQCFGILLFCNSFHTDNIRIVTESREFAWILPKLFKRAFDLSFDSFPSLEAPGKLVFQIYDPEKVHYIMSSFGFDSHDVDAAYDGESLRKAEEMVREYDLNYIGKPEIKPLFL